MKRLALIFSLAFCHFANAQFTFSESKYVTIKSNSTSELSLSNSKVKSIDPNKYAIIIGNENYTSTLDVPYAINDASLFKDYCRTILGVDSSHVLYLQNATSIQIKRAVKQLNTLQELNKDSSQVILYYSGHGLANDEGSLQLLPSDVSPIDLIGSIDLFNICNELNLTRTKQIAVFVDACFSGESRTKNIVSSRGIRIVPKFHNLPVNCTVITASSINQKAFPYSEKKHGAYTYFLLKELKANERSMDQLHEKVSKELSRWSIKNGMYQECQIIRNVKGVKFKI